MSGSDILANISLGRFVYYVTLPAASDTFVAILLEASGLVADDTLRDYDDVAAVLAGATNEQTTAGRKTISSFTVTVDDTNNRVDVDVADQVWTGLTGNAIGKVCFAYDPTGASADSGLIPVSYHSFDITPDGSDVTLQVAAAGLLRATG